MDATLPGLEGKNEGTKPQPSTTPGRVVRVRPDIVPVDRTFDYSIPESWEADGRAEKVEVGSLVRIDFHGRRRAGWVVGLDVEPEPGIEVRPLAKWSSVGPPAELVELAEWAAWRWAGRVPHFLRAASPPRMVATLPTVGDQRVIDTGAGHTSLFDGPLTLVQSTPSDDGLGLALAAAARGRALILTPTIGQRDRMVEALRRRGIPVASYNDQWERSAAGATTVGTRLAAWAPMPRIDAYLVVDEHDTAYKEERTPAWNARDVVVERARRSAAPCVLMSPSPSLDALESADRRLVPERSAQRHAWPVVEVVDLRDAEVPGLLSPQIVPVLRGEGPVACILNRKGRARMLACASCDTLATCDACTAAVARPDDRLVCSSCGTARPVVCNECGATKMKVLRSGVGRVAEELRALTRLPVTEVTTETPQRDLTGDRLLIGTEALLRRLQAATAVIFLDFDQELAVPRSRASEHAFALLALSARLVGPRAQGGRVIVQTRRPHDVVIEAARHGDPDRLARQQRDIRRVFGQPPYGAWAVVSGAGAEEFVDRIGTRLRVSRLGDRWRLAADDHVRLLDVLATTDRPADRIRLEVDPLDI